MYIEGAQLDFHKTP